MLKKLKFCANLLLLGHMGKDDYTLIHNIDHGLDLVFLRQDLHPSIKVLATPMVGGWQGPAQHTRGCTRGHRVSSPLRRQDDKEAMFLDRRIMLLLRLWDQGAQLHYVFYYFYSIKPSWWIETRKSTQSFQFWGLHLIYGNGLQIQH